MIIDYLLANGWTPEDILSVGATLTVALLAIAGAVVGLERLLKRADEERAATYAPLDDLMDGPEQVGDDTLAMVAEDRDATDMWDSFEEANVHGIHVHDPADLDALADHIAGIVRDVVATCEADAEDARNAMQYAIHPVGRERFHAEVEAYLKEQA